MKTALGVLLCAAVMGASAEAKAEGVLRAVGAAGTEGAQLRAVSTVYRANTLGSEATVELRQVFENAGTGRVRFVWTAPEGAVVRSARLHPGGPTQESLAPDTRSISLEGAAARGEVEVWITFRLPLVTSGLRRELHLPVLATPSRGRQLVVSVHVSDTPPLQRIVSPSHTVRIARPHPREADVELAPGRPAQNREYVLQWERGASSTVGTLGVGGGTPMGGVGSFGGSHSLADASDVRGDVQREPIRAVVAQNLSRFRTCYTASLVRDASAEGRVLSDVVIGREGQVLDATLVDNAIRDAGFESCVVGVWRSLRFPTITGRVIRLRYPLRFTPGA